MNRTSRIAIGLFVPSVLFSIGLALSYSYLSALEAINPFSVIVMLIFIVTSVASGTFTAYFFKGLSFKPKQDILFVYLNALPWVAFIILFFNNFWILILPIIITPILGYWFGKRYFSL